MKISDVENLIEASHQADDSVLIVGVHGLGKTDVIKSWAKNNNVHLEVLYLSNQEVGDLIGLPKITEVHGELVTTWTVPIWLQKLQEASSNGQKTAIFLDEFSRAPLDVRQCALQLVLDKKIHQHKLPVTNNTETMIIAADNPDDGNYQVEALDPALLDRFLVADVEPDVPAWLDWAREHKINNIVRSFIADNPTKLFFSPEEGSESKITATGRSWAKLASYIDIIDNIKPILHYPIIKGKIGDALAAQFLNYLNNYKKMISVEDIENLTNNLLEKGADIKVLEKSVKELIENIEPIQKTELTESLYQKFITKDSYKDAMPLMAMLYALDVEILVAILKKIRDKEEQNPNKNLYLKLAKFDEEMNNKKLFIRMVNQIKGI